LLADFFAPVLLLAPRELDAFFDAPLLEDFFDVPPPDDPDFLEADFDADFFEPWLEPRPELDFLLAADFFCPDDFLLVLLLAELFEADEALDFFEAPEELDFAPEELDFLDPDFFAAGSSVSTVPITSCIPSTPSSPPPDDLPPACEDS
jgi:hypothetical protein